MKVDVYNQKGEKVDAITLPKEYFGAEVNTGLLHEAVVRQQSNSRKAIAHVKTRGEVKCSTKKIYRQKGTGGARHGARSANIFRGGGTVFGPRNTRNFKVQMSKKMRRRALTSALSSRAEDKDIFVLDKYEVDSPKTKDFAAMLKNMPESKDYLLVIPAKNNHIEKSARNVPNVKTILVNYLNPVDLLTYKKIMFLSESINKIPSIFPIN